MSFLAAVNLNMSLRLRVVLLACVILAIELAAGITTAPGDEEQELCQGLRDLGVAPIPDYAPNMRVLMDSWNYQNFIPPSRSGAVWDQVDNDTSNSGGMTTNWIQQSNTPCQQTVQVCGFTSGPQSNWLFTQAINRTVDGSPLSQVGVLIEFELRNCDVTLNCQRTFNTHVYETSFASGAARRDLSNYRQVTRVSPDVTTGDRVNETIVLIFRSNQPLFYFAVEDETTCIIITRMIIFYNICPNRIINLVSAPEIVAPTTGFITMDASCVSNAAPEDDTAPKLICSSEGNWTLLGSGCRCAPGSGFVDGSCSLCRAGTYSSPANRNCSTCPENSTSTMPGLRQCNCRLGFYRAVTGEEDMPCSLPPLPPMNIRLTVISDNSILVTWDPPAENPSNRPLTYSVYTSLDGGERFPVVGGINATNYTIMNLLPGRMYTVFVSTSTSFSDQLPDALFAGFSASDVATTSGSSGGGDVVAIAVAVVVVLLFVIVAGICVAVFLIWFFLKANNNDGSKDLIAQYHEVSELAEATGRKMYVDPSIYASPDEAVRDFAKEIPPKFLSMKQEIGRGEFGAVYKGVWKSGGKQVPVAIKTLKPHSSAKQRNDFLSEASIMGQFTHPNVVKLYGVVTRVDPVMIIMEFLENGSLYHYLRDNDEKLGNERLLKMARGVAQGMDYLSTIGFVHRDLAARNILVSKNEICKVADFGLSRETVDEIYKVNKGGKIPVRWTAPEAIFRRKFTVSSDVWSFGVLLWEIMTYGQTPYDEMDNQELLDKLDDGYRLEKPHNAPDEVYKLMLECWNEDHIKRPTFAVIEANIEELLKSDSAKLPPKKPKTYMYSSSVATSPLDYSTVNEWLDGLKMGKYKPNFEERGITTTNEVLNLDEQQLRKMDITLAGHISKITRSIAVGNQKLGREASVRV